METEACTSPDSLSDSTLFISLKNSEQPFEAPSDSNNNNNNDNNDNNDDDNSMSISTKLRTLSEQFYCKIDVVWVTAKMIIRQI